MQLMALDSSRPGGIARFETRNGDGAHVVDWIHNLLPISQDAGLPFIWSGLKFHVDQSNHPTKLAASCHLYEAY